MFKKTIFSLIKLTNVPQYNIYRFPKQLTKLHDFKFQSQYMKDDLLIPEHQLKNGVVSNMVKYLRENPESEVHFKGIGLLLYHMANEDIYDPMVIKRFEQNLFKFKLLFTHRLAFGAFYGFIKLNINNFYMQEFFEKELSRFKDKITVDEAIELTESMGNNTTLTQEYLHGIIVDMIKPVILKKYSRTVRHNPGQQLRLFAALSNVKYFDEELFDLVLKGLINQHKIRKLDTWLQVLHTIRKLKEDKFPRSLDGYEHQLLRQLKQRDDFHWIFNFKLEQYYTMEEMIAKREDYVYTNQRQGLYQLNPEMLGNYIKYSKEGGRIEISKEQADLEQDQELQDLLQEKFIQAKIGEYDASEIIGEKQIMDMFNIKQQPGGYQAQEGDDDDDTEEESESDEEKQELLQQQKKAEIVKKATKELKRRKGKDSFTKFSQPNDQQD